MPSILVTSLAGELRTGYSATEQLLGQRWWSLLLHVKSSAFYINNSLSRTALIPNHFSLHITFRRNS